MELHPTPFPGKTRPVKPNPNTTRKTIDPSKKNSKEIPVPRQKRVFGIVRDTNIPVKTIDEKPTIKPSFGIIQKKPKSTRISSNTADKALGVAEKKSPVKNRAGFKKKSVCFEERIVENPTKIPFEEDTGCPRTPEKLALSNLTKSKIKGTPYYSAENCSKCRYDKLENSSYWLGQIKLAELAGKHFVSATFFRLALECKAEPIRNLRVELKKYMARHEYLSAQTEWRDVSMGYGLLKDESSAGNAGSGTRKSKTDVIEDDQEQKEVKELAVESLEIKI